MQRRELLAGRGATIVGGCGGDPPRTEPRPSPALLDELFTDLSQSLVAAESLQIATSALTALGLEADRRELEAADGIARRLCQGLLVLGSLVDLSPEDRQQIVHQPEVEVVNQIVGEAVAELEALIAAEDEASLAEIEALLWSEPELLMGVSEHVADLGVQVGLSPAGRRAHQRCALSVEQELERASLAEVTAQTTAWLAQARATAGSSPAKAKEQEDAAISRQTRNLVIAGSVLTGLGAGSAAVIVPLAAMAAQITAFGFGVWACSGGVVLFIGLVLLIVGLVRRRREREAGAQ